MTFNLASSWRDLDVTRTGSLYSKELKRLFIKESSFAISSTMIECQVIESIPLTKSSILSWRKPRKGALQFSDFHRADRDFWLFTGQFFSSCAPHMLIIEFLKLCSPSLQLHRGVSGFQSAAAMRGHPSWKIAEKISPSSPSLLKVSLTLHRNAHVDSGDLLIHTHTHTQSENRGTVSG